MSDFDALLALLAGAIVLGALLASLGVLRVEVKGPAAAGQRQVGRRRQDGPPTGAPLNALPAGPAPKEDTQTRM